MMGNEEGEAQKRQFVRTKDNILFRMALQEQHSLTIHLTYCETNCHRQLELTPEALLTDEHLARCFETPHDLYEEIASNFQDLLVLPQGTIMFEVPLGRRRRIPIRLDTQPFCPSEQTLSEQLVRVEKEGAQKIAQLAKQLFQQAEHNQKLQAEVERLANELASAPAHRQAIALELAAIKEQTEQLKTLLLIVNTDNLELKQRVKQLELQEKENDDLEDDCKVQAPPGEILEDQPAEEYPREESYCSLESGDEEERRIYKFVGYTKHRNNQDHFEVLLKGKVLRRSSSHPGWQNFMLNSMLKPGTTYSLQVELTKAQGTQVFAGVASGHLTNLYNTKKSPEFLSCDLLGSCIWAAGRVVHRNSAMGFREKDALLMQVDLCRNRVEWFRRRPQEADFQSVGWAVLPRNLQGTTLFPLLTLRHFGDTLTILD